MICFLRVAIWTAYREYLSYNSAVQPDLNWEQVVAFGQEWLREKLHFKQKHDHRLETTLAMLERYGVIDLSLLSKECAVIDELPARLLDESYLERKRLRDQQKLYTLVQYVKCDGDRKEFIQAYFGLSGDSA